MKTFRYIYPNNVIINIFLFMCFFNSITISSQVHSWQNTSSIRLPTSIQPIKYNLHINISIHDDILDFHGNVVIDFEVKESTSEIVLHAKKLRDFAINLKDVRNRRRFENLKYSMPKQKDFLIISVPKQLQNGERYRLEIIYMGRIQEDDFNGIYKTSYLDEFYNKSIPIAVTQFQPNNARMAFPCFDEPSFRAKFVITITHGRFYSALSNMPIDGQPSWNNNMITTIFRETPPMPTYLVGFVICNFDYNSVYNSGVEHRVFYPPNSKDKGSRALTNSIQSMALFEKYLGIEYPLPKIDHIHFKDADMVATDWGLAIYRNDEFLQTLEDRESTVKRIVMQNYLISQQWFANMVSLKWWSFAWLNSGLGTYYSYKITDLMYPTWKIEEFFILTEIDEFLKEDIKLPLVHSIQTEENIESSIDDASFQMGAGIIKMFSHAIGNETFTKGLIKYLNKFKNSVTEEDDFFGAIQSAIADDFVYLFQIDKSLAEIMKTWTHNPGIPVVKVTRQYNNGTISIQQRPYSGKGHEKWWIPLNFATASNGNFDRTTTDYIMPPFAKVSLNLEDINVSLMSSDWLILNKQQTGLYYVVYDDRNLDLIANVLNKNHTEIHMLNRAVLFRDLKAVLDSDLGAIEPLLDALKYLKNEQDSMPWFEASELINEIWSRLKGGKAFERFRTFIYDIIGNYYNNFSEIPLYKLSFADSIVKKSIYKLACEVEVSECLDNAKHQTKEYLNYNWPIDESMKEFIMCKGMQSVESEELKEILQKILYPNVSWDKEQDFLKTLRCVTSEENINIIFDFVHEDAWSVRKLSISTYMSMYHAAYHDRIANAGRKRPKRELNARPDILTEIERKRVEFKRKYEESIYNWLKDYELNL